MNAQPRSRGPILTGLMFGISMISYFDRTIMGIAGPSILKEYQLTETQLGTIYSAFLMTYAILMIPAGRLSDRIGPRITLGITALGSGIFTALTAAGGQPWLTALVGLVPGFMLARLAMGVFTSPLYPAAGRMTANWFPVEMRARVMGIVNSGAGLGSATSPMLFAWLMSSYGWRTSFLFAGAATLLIGVVWLLFAQDYSTAPKTPVKADPVNWPALLLNPQMILITIGYFAVDYFEYIFFYWSYYYFGQVRKLGQEQSAVYTTIMMLVFFVMTPMGGWLSDRMVQIFGLTKGLRIVGMGGLALSAILLFIGTRVDTTEAAVAFMSLALGFASCADVTFWAAVINVGGRNSGTAGGIMNSGGNVGGFIAPILTPWIAERAGWAGGLYFGSVMALVGMAVWWWIDPTKKLVESELPTAH